MSTAVDQRWLRKRAASGHVPTWRVRVAAGERRRVPAGVHNRHQGGLLPRLQGYRRNHAVTLDFPSRDGQRSRGVCGHDLRGRRGVDLRRRLPAIRQRLPRDVRQACPNPSTNIRHEHYLSEMGPSEQPDGPMLQMMAANLRADYRLRRRRRPRSWPPRRPWRCRGRGEGHSC